MSNGNNFNYNHNIDYLYKIADLSTVGGRIRYYREKNGLKQEELAALSMVERCTVIRYENNEVPPTLETVHKFASVLKIEKEVLYDDYLTFISSDPGLRIKEYRTSLQLSRPCFAKELGVHPDTVRDWEIGERRMSRRLYDKFKKFFMN